MHFFPVFVLLPSQPSRNVCFFGTHIKPVFILYIYKERKVKFNLIENKKKWAIINLNVYKKRKRNKTEKLNNQLKYEQKFMNNRCCKYTKYINVCTYKYIYIKKWNVFSQKQQKNNCKKGKTKKKTTKKTEF